MIQRGDDAKHNDEIHDEGKQKSDVENAGDLLPSFLVLPIQFCARNPPDTDGSKFG